MLLLKLLFFLQATSPRISVGIKDIGISKLVSLKFIDVKFSLMCKTSFCQIPVDFLCTDNTGGLLNACVPRFAIGGSRCLKNGSSFRDESLFNL